MGSLTISEALSKRSWTSVVWGPGVDLCALCPRLLPWASHRLFTVTCCPGSNTTAYLLVQGQRNWKALEPFLPLGPEIICRTPGQPASDPLPILRASLRASSQGTESFDFRWGVDLCLWRMKRQVLVSGDAETGRGMDE